MNFSVGVLYFILEYRKIRPNVYVYASFWLPNFGLKIVSLVEQISGMTNLALEIDEKSVPDAKTPTPVVQGECKTAALKEKQKY